jgi:hypothetical protein
MLLPSSGLKDGLERRKVITAGGGEEPDPHYWEEWIRKWPFPGTWYIFRGGGVLRKDSVSIFQECRTFAAITLLELRDYLHCLLSGAGGVEFFIFLFLLF